MPGVRSSSSGQTAGRASHPCVGLQREYPNSASLIPIQEESEAVLQEIQRRGILSVQMVYGQSMGAEIGLTLMHLMENAEISVKSAFLDGMPAGSSYVLEGFTSIPELFLRSCSSFSRLPV